jgi:RimJ/RimL family protein N-acetyltransferase
MDDHSAQEHYEALRPIDSLISKSDKAQQKVAPGTWQHTMLRDNVNALRIARSLMTEETDDDRDVTHEELREALRAFASMVERTEKSQAKFPAGTSQHSLQRNRLAALRVGEAFVKAEFDRCSMNDHTPVSLRPYGPQDLTLLRRLLGDPEMMTHLGGPESEKAIRERHERYLATDAAPQGLFAVLEGTAEEPVGWVGYWESTWDGQQVWECGWHLVPEAQGRGIATDATRLMLAHARATGLHRFVHAFPAVDNVASNALCERLGFELLGEAQVEYPKGRPMLVNDWRLDLESD